MAEVGPGSYFTKLAGGEAVAQPWSDDWPATPGLEPARRCWGSRHFRAECGHFSETPRLPAGCSQATATIAPH